MTHKELAKHGREGLHPTEIQRLDELKRAVKSEPGRADLYQELLARVLYITEVLFMLNAQTSDEEPKVQHKNLSLIGTMTGIAERMLKNPPAAAAEDTTVIDAISDIKTKLDANDE